MLEGGGQILRTTVALAALLEKDVKVTRIRAKRRNPGLQAQHITAVKAVAAISNAETEGLQLRSDELVFRPRGHATGQFRFDVGTAGSIPLILQAAMPSAAFAQNPITLELTGGTDVPWSPTIDYVRLVELPVLAQLGYKAALTVHRRGHYPKGGGLVTMTIDPPKFLNAFQMIDRGSPQGVNGISHCVKLPSHVAQRQAAAAKQKLENEGIQEVNIAIETYSPNQDPHAAPGSGIALAAKFANGQVLGADGIGERGKPAERVGEEAANNLLAELHSNASVDRHMGDILIPYMAVAEGCSEIHLSKITTHTITNIKVAEILSGVKFNVQGELNQAGTISVEGLGLRT